MREIDHLAIARLRVLAPGWWSSRQILPSDLVSSPYLLKGAMTRLWRSGAVERKPDPNKCSSAQAVFFVYRLRRDPRRG